MIQKLRKFIWAALFIPAITFAQNPILNNTTDFGLPDRFTNFDRTGTLSGAIIGLVQTLLSIAGILAVAFIIWGGFRYITSRGDEKVVGEAKKTILNAIIGLVVIILSYVIVSIVSNAAFGRI